MNGVKAKLRYLPNTFEILEKGDYVECAVSKKKIPIDDIFYCPFHPKIGNHYYKRKSYLRKPNPGMILEAKKKYNIDLNKSFMIGNSIVDYEAAIAANVYPLIINNRNINIKKKFKFSNINKAIHFIKLRIGF